MDALSLSFLKLWRQATTTSTISSTVPHLVVETDSESDEEESFFDLELPVHDFDNKENNNTINKNDGNPEDKTMRESKGVGSNQEGLSITAKRVDDSEVGISKTTLSLSPKEPISKRKVLPIYPLSKPQSPIALLKSAPSFRVFMFRKPKGMGPQRTEEIVKTHKQQKNETKVFAAKLNVEEPHSFPTLGRDNSMRSHGSGSKIRNQSREETKSERFSKDVLQKYLKLIKPLYVKVSKRYSDKMKFSEEVSSACPMASPSVASVSSRKEKQRVVPKHLGKSRSASAANRSDDTLLQQHDGIQSAILHCKRSFNSGDSSIILSTEGSTMDSVRNSLEENRGKHVM